MRDFIQSSNYECSKTQFSLKFMLSQHLDFSIILTELYTVPLVLFVISLTLLGKVAIINLLAFRNVFAVKLLSITSFDSIEITVP